jgi:CRISPR-associated protein Cas1
MSSQSAKSTGGDSQNNAWAKRCEFWQAKISHPTRRKLNSSIHRQPLVLTGHGVSLRVEAGSLSIKNGFTHYPQKQESFRFFPGDLDLPTRIVLLDVSGGISFDVLNWLSTQQVPLIQLNWQGEVICVSSQSGHSTNPYRVEWQRETRGDHTKRMEFCNSLIAKKIDGTIVTLEKSIPRSVSWEKAMQQAYQTLAQIEHSPPRTVGECRCYIFPSLARYPD